MFLPPSEFSAAGNASNNASATTSGRWGTLSAPGSSSQGFAVTQEAESETGRPGTGGETSKVARPQTPPPAVRDDEHSRPVAEAPTMTPGCATCQSSTAVLGSGAGATNAPTIIRFSAEEGFYGLPREGK